MLVSDVYWISVGCVKEHMIRRAAIYNKIRILGYAMTDLRPNKATKPLLFATFGL